MVFGQTCKMHCSCDRQGCSFLVPYRSKREGGERMPLKIDGDSPKVVDVFAGVGGLSLGATRAGFSLRSAVEIDETALGTHSTNFPNTIHIAKDVSCLSGENLLCNSNLLPGELTGLIGGPPCQGFSFIGKRALDDPRNSLFVHFFRLVAETGPAFFLAENVPGILDERYTSIVEKAFSLVREKYHILSPFLATASDYGAPTNRKRVLFVGYDPSRFRALRSEDFSPSITHEDQIHVRRALAGLPSRIDSSWQTEKEGIRQIFKPTKISKGSFEHAYTDHIPLGVGNPEVIEKYKTSNEVYGCLGTRHSNAVETRFASLLPGEIDPISRAPRLDPNGFCPTLRAGTGKERGSHQALRPIHYEVPRVITPREAARLQGFPDWFLFHSTKWHSFRQIGNSVSPILAERILLKIRGLYLS